MRSSGMGVGGESWRSAKPGSTKNAQKHTDNVTLGSCHTCEKNTTIPPLFSPRHLVSAPHISLHIRQISHTPRDLPRRINKAVAGGVFVHK